MASENRLYIWIEGDIHHPDAPPEIHTKIAPDMPLTTFRDKYVNTHSAHVVVRVYHASDDKGQDYQINLVPLSPPDDIAAETETPPDSSLTLIKGIGNTLAKRFHAIGIHSAEDLLLSATTTAQRESLSAQVKQSAAKLLHWAQQADLMRVNGIGEDYGLLLRKAGIVSISELQMQTPQRLSRLLKSTNTRLKVVERLPSDADISDWISQAQALSPILS